MTDGFALFRSLLADWLEKTSLFPGKNLHIDLIVNPHAGGLRHEGKRRALTDALVRAMALSPGGAQRTDRTVKVSTWVTDYPGHEKAILAHLQAADPTGPGDQRLVVIAGGDGTSRGALISALGLPQAVREQLLFFRLPLGTGNDAAESRDWNEALDLLSGRGSLTAQAEPLKVIEVRVPGQEPHYSFNIASVGLDAFVVHMTNRLKSWFPGDSYSLMVDVAALFYEAFVRVVPSTLVLSAQGQRVLEWNQAFLLAALGASGHRTYGAGKKILPDADNFCLAGRKNLFTKLSYRKPFYRGTHRDLDGIVLASGDRLEVTSPVRIPLQMDGEVLWLDPTDFPVSFEVQDRGLQALRPSPKL